MQDTSQAFRKRSKLSAWLGSACLVATLNAAPAHAYLSSAAYSAVFGCSRQVATEARAAPTRIESAKSSAILGGQPSALDLISAQQTSEAALSQSFAAEQVMAPTSAMPCPLGAVAKLAEFAPVFNKIPVSGDFLGSERVAIGRTPLDRAWRRVSRKTGSVWAVTSLVRQRSETDADHLGKVNTWVNRNIEFVEDKALYGRSDYWATRSQWPGFSG